MTRSCRPRRGDAEIHHEVTGEGPTATGHSVYFERAARSNERVKGIF